MAHSPIGPYGHAHNSELGASFHNNDTTNIHDGIVAVRAMNLSDHSAQNLGASTFVRVA